ncbi:MAG: hypothetical protein N2746_12070 [Deltaproteobacteria bacterium]|nr:hypothetical protein [Deltaproteobacteria bacterium]
MKRFTLAIDLFLTVGLLRKEELKFFSSQIKDCLFADRNKRDVNNIISLVQDMNICRDTRFVRR